MGEVGVVVFLLGGWTLAPRRKFEISKKINQNQLNLHSCLDINPPPPSMNLILSFHFFSFYFISFFIFHFFHFL